MTRAPQNNLVGILCAVGAAFAFSFNDMAIKFLSGNYALHEVVLFRSAIGLTFLMIFVVPFEGGLSVLRTRRLSAHLFRGACVVFSNMAFFLAIAAMPLAEAVAIFFVSPILITIFGAIFLGETVGPRRWMAAVAGLLGVIVMLRPGLGTFQLASLLPLAAAFGYAALHVMTRRIGGTEKAATMAFYIQVTFIVVSGAMGLAFADGRYSGGGDPSLDFLFRAWSVPASGDIIWLVLIGAASTAGGYLISQAYRMAEAGLAAPFEYVAMPLAIFWGITMFGEWPDAVAWIGIALIVGSGLYTFWREAVHGRPVAAETPARR
jgi:drug/metabolite transporter (DMT)-like permease